MPQADGSFVILYLPMPGRHAHAGRPDSVSPFFSSGLCVPWSRSSAVELSCCWAEGQPSVINEAMSDVAYCGLYKDELAFPKSFSHAASVADLPDSQNLNKAPNPVTVRPAVHGVPSGRHDVTRAAFCGDLLSGDGSTCLSDLGV